MIFCNPPFRFYIMDLLSPDSIMNPKQPPPCRFYIMDPRYFSSALIELSETLRPYEGSDVTHSVEKLVKGLIEENENLGITR